MPAVSPSDLLEALDLIEAKLIHLRAAASVADPNLDTLWDREAALEEALSDFDALLWRAHAEAFPKD